MEPAVQPVIVEFPIQPGVVPVGRLPQDLARDSAKALEEAMGTIRQMSAWARDGITDLVDPPDTFEVTFGIKLTAEAGVLISKIGGEAALQVKLGWQRDAAGP